MVLAARGAEAEPGLIDLFAAGGIDPARVTLVGRRPRRDYLRLYHEADIALDTFPYAGHTTTLDALWMGVPTVTLARRTHVARAGLSVLSAVGLAECVAYTTEQYVDVAARLASDLPRLAELRRGLRQRVTDSPLADARGLAGKLEAAFREMWRRWCQREGANG
jgi:predicted O-linked N-acetylglucosamine transferase (SPINDLY family)